ncbi:MAG: ABC transporter permease [Bacillota bacterium]|nr:ABC transporter permease [Bacillota bacterium]
MSDFRAAYINELYKISKKKKITVTIILSVLAVILTGIVVYAINRFAGIRITGYSEFPTLALSVFSYTLIPLFTAFVCIDMFSSEFVEQTIKITLTGPASRFKVFTAKVLAAATFIAANLLFVMLITLIVSLFINGIPTDLFKIILSYIFEFFPIFVFALMIILICNITKGTVSAFMISILVFLLLNGLGIVFSAYKSFLFTSAFDWYKLFLGSYINFHKIFRVFVILCGYGIMLFGISNYLFDKKEL